MILVIWFVLQQSRDLNLMTAQEKQMEVCEVCGAFLIIGDAQTRVDDHLQGKQHMGYAKIKSTIEELKVSAYLWALISIFKLNCQYYTVGTSVSMLVMSYHQCYKRLLL